MADKNFAFGFILSAALSSKFSGSFAKASQEIEQLSEHMQKLQAQAMRMQKAFDKGIISQKTYNVANKMAQEKAVQKYSTAANGAFNEGFVNAGALYYKAQVVASVFTAPIQAAMKFESSMADVNKVVDFDTPQQFKEMSRDILELSKRIPMTAEALAQIVASGGQSGIAKQDLTAFAESAAKMGVAFDITAEQAGDMMAKWRTAFKMGQDDVNKLADKINYLGNTTTASAPRISDVVTRIGPLGEVGGVASGEIAALGASMVGAGIQSEVAATGLKNMILTLVSGESATKSHQEAFAALGMDSTTLAQRMQVDAKGAILDVLSAIEGLDKASQAATLQKLFGKESLGAITPLLSNLDGLKENFEKVAKAENYAGSMEAEFAARADTTENSVQLMNNRIDAAKIAIGNGLLPVIASLAELIGGMASGIGYLASEFPGLTKAFLLAGGGVAILYGGLKLYKIIQLEVNAAKSAYLALANTSIGMTLRAAAAAKIAAVSTKLMSIAQLAMNFAMYACPVGIFIAGVLAIGAAGYALYKNWDVVKEFFITLWNDPMAAIQSFIDGIYAKFGEAFAWLLDKWNGVKQFFSAPITATVNAVKNGMGIAQNATGGIYGKGAFLTTFAENSSESAIPHTPNARNIGLLAETNRIMGNPLGGGNRHVL